MSAQLIALEVIDDLRRLHERIDGLDDDVMTELRIEASNIVAKMRQNSEIAAIARQLNIPKVYCHFVHSVNNRWDDPTKFLCPNWVILQVLAFREQNARKEGGG